MRTVLNQSGFSLCVVSEAVVCKHALKCMNEGWCVNMTSSHNMQHDVFWSKNDTKDHICITEQVPKKHARTKPLIQYVKARKEY